MPDRMVIDACSISNSYTTVFKDINGNEFRIKFDRIEGGITINKMSDKGISSIIINPIVSNEIRVK